VDDRASRARTLAAVTLGGVLMYLLIDAALRFLEPQYSLLRNAESDYGNGAFAWLMDLNFLLRATFSLAAVGAIALAWRLHGWVRTGLALVAMWAVASGLLAFFSDDLAGTPVTTSGRLHVLLALIAFVAMAVGALSVSVGLAREAGTRAMGFWLTGIAVVGLLVLPLVGRPPIRLDIGLFERIFLGVEPLWLAAVSWWTYGTAPRMSPSGTA